MGDRFFGVARGHRRWLSMIFEQSQERQFAWSRLKFSGDKAEISDLVAKLRPLASTREYARAIMAYGRVKAPEEALELFHEDQKDKFTYAAVIGAMSRSGEFDRARQIFEEMPEPKDTVATKSYMTSLIYQGRHPDAADVFDRAHQCRYISRRLQYFLTCVVCRSVLEVVGIIPRRDIEFFWNFLHLILFSLSF